MYRTSKLFGLALALALVAGSAGAQEFVFGWNPRSGDMWVDTQLSDINRYGYRYRDPFVDEMTRYYGAPRDLVTDLLVRRRWAPGDIYFACALAQVAGLPCRRVADEWERDHGQGWGVLAQRLGIKPGSPEFHRLKRGFVPTYDHWGRPIELDSSLRVDFPNRGKGPKGTSDHGHGNGRAHASEHGHGGDHGHGGAHGNSGHGQGKKDTTKSGQSKHGGHDGSGQGNGGKHGNSGKQGQGGKGHGHGGH